MKLSKREILLKVILTLFKYLGDLFSNFLFWPMLIVELLSPEKTNLRENKTVKQGYTTLTVICAITNLVWVIMLIFWVIYFLDKVVYGN